MEKPVPQGPASDESEAGGHVTVPALQNSAVVWIKAAASPALSRKGLFPRVSFSNSI